MPVRNGSLGAVLRRLFSFPNPVNEVAARTVAAGVIALTVATLASGQHWLTVPLAYGFVARVASGPRLSPLGQVASRLVAPRLTRWAKFSPGPPKRFAQAMGAGFSLAAMSLWLAGLTLESDVVLAALLVPAALEAGIGFCAGCYVFRALMRLGVVPETVCQECSDLWGTAGARPLATR
jgi:hypothetical protein